LTQSTESATSHLSQPLPLGQSRGLERPFDCRVTGAQARAVIQRHLESINDRDRKVLADFRQGDLLLAALPDIAARVELFQRIWVSRNESELFAKSALELRYGEDWKATSPIRPGDLVQARRHEDAPDLTGLVEARGTVCRTQGRSVGGLKQPSVLRPMLQEHLPKVRRIPLSSLLRIGPRLFVAYDSGFRYALRVTPGASVELLSVCRLH
jgi:hypothetical protein